MSQDDQTIPDDEPMPTKEQVEQAEQEDRAADEAAGLNQEEEFDPTWDEMEAMVIDELMQADKKRRSSQPGNTSQSPQIPDWYREAYNDG